MSEWNEQEVLVRAQGAFLADWLLEHRSEAALQADARRVELDVTVPRAVAALRLREPLRRSAEQTGSAYRQLAAAFLQESCCLTWMGSTLAIFLQVEDSRAALQQVEQALHLLPADLADEVYGGVGSVCREPEHIRISYDEARYAMGVSAERGGISRYEELSMDRLLAAIPDRAKREFAGEVFRGCSEKEVLGWMEVLEVFFKHDGALSHAAEELGIHKNTLQYRIGKLVQRTGHDPRTLRSGLPLYLAMQMIRQSRGGEG